MIRDIIPDAVSASRVERGTSSCKYEVSTPLGVCRTLQRLFERATIRYNTRIPARGLRRAVETYASSSVFRVGKVLRIHGQNLFQNSTHRCHLEEVCHEDLQVAVQCFTKAHLLKNGRKAFSPKPVALTPHGVIS